MKITFVALNFYLILNCILALQTNNSQQGNNALIKYHSASDPHELAHQHHNHAHHQNDIATNNRNQPEHLHPTYLRGDSYHHKPHSHNTAITQRQNDVNNKKNGRLHRTRNQSQKHTTVTRRPVNPADSRVVHPRFRPLFQSLLSKTTAVALNSNKNNIQPNGKIPKHNTTKSSGLLQAFTAKSIDKNPQSRRRISFADYYHQQQFKSFFGHQHEKLPAGTRSNIKTGLRR